MKQSPVYTYPSSCRDCYRCVRVCPVGSIRVARDEVSVISDECVACGQCVRECPKGLQRVRSDVDRVVGLLRSSKRVLVSLAPSWVSEFPDVTAGALLASLRALGFRWVSEMALGADMLNRYVAQHYEQHPSQVVFLPGCPAAMEFIQNRYPHYTPWILSAATPLLSHAGLLRKYFGSDIAVVAITPCVAQKMEADRHPEAIDAAITFAELHSWFLDQGVSTRAKEAAAYDADVEEFVPLPASGGARYAMRGGMVEELKMYIPPEAPVHYAAYSGFDSIRAALDGLESWGNRGKFIVELMACEGGCVNSPAASHQQSLALRQQSLVDSYPVRCALNHSCLFPAVDMSYDYQQKRELQCEVISPQQVAEQLKRVGQNTRQDNSDCGCCGYATCQDFGRALCRGTAEPTMCVSYQREVAQGQFDVLFNHMPSGVALVDDSLRILQINWNLARMLGHDAELAYDRNPGLEGLSAEQYLPFHKVITTVLRSREAVLNRDQAIGDYVLSVSVFLVERFNIACAIVRNLYSSDVRNDEIARRAEDLITKNLTTVQQIAYLLGESAAETETVLNSIMESLGRKEGENA